MDRNCNKCIHHTSGQCCKWICEMETLDDFRNKVIVEFASALIPRLTDAIHKKDIESITNLINDIVKELQVSEDDYY